MNNFFFISGRHTSQKLRSHHSIIPLWIYRIPSELRSQARLGPISTAVGDHAGILGVECFFSVNFFTFFFVVKFFCFTHFFFSQNLRLCGLFCFEFSPTNSAFHWFFRLKIQRMQNAPPNQGKKKSRKKNKPANRG